MFWGLIPTFVEVTREKMVRGIFAQPSILNRVKVSNSDPEAPSSDSSLNRHLCRFLKYYLGYQLFQCHHRHENEPFHHILVLTHQLTFFFILSFHQSQFQRNVSQFPVLFFPALSFPQTRYLILITVQSLLSVHQTVYVSQVSVLDPQLKDLSLLFCLSDPWK